MLELDQEFWDSKYREKSFGWDLGEISPPLKEYFNQLEDKNIAILIPGCGNSYETHYLLEMGFTNITLIDISPTLTNELRNKFKNNKSVKIMCEDFFGHNDQYDLVVEQTFFCAINPTLREKYCVKTKQLLSKNGKLAGLLFDIVFEKAGPPFGGSKEEYTLLFSKYFNIKTIENCYNSFFKRANTELFFIAHQKRTE
jgi:SAM-dependent methyltransferase